MASDEEIDHIQPTSGVLGYSSGVDARIGLTLVFHLSHAGFVIKAVQTKQFILSVKEIGGGIPTRYWVAILMFFSPLVVLKVKNRSESIGVDISPTIMGW